MKQEQKQVRYFKEFNAQIKKCLKTFEHLSTAEFETLKQQAAAELAKHCQICDTVNRPTIHNDFVFISSADSLQGFYNVGSRQIIEPETGRKLLLIAFERVKKYNAKKNAWEAETLQPMAIYEDSAENYFFIHQQKINTSPLEKWQNDLHNEIFDNQLKIEGWQKVKQLYKKDGGEFANVQKNFDGATVEKDFSIYGEFNGLNITIYYKNARGGYDSAKIYASQQDGAKTIADVMPTIAKEIARLQASTEAAQKLLQHSEKIFFEFVQPFVETLARYETGSNADGIKVKYLQYKIGDILKNIYISF